MRRLLISLPMLFAFLSSAYPAENVFFDESRHQMAINLGLGMDTGIIVPMPVRPVPFTMVHIQYSQPTTFFRLPARQSINITQTIGFGEKYGWQWDRYTVPIISLSQDVALLHGQDWYFGTGLGVGFQAQQNERISSKLLFGFKIFAGYKISENISGEVFMQHYSNGNTAAENNSYTFYGLGFVYNFDI